MKIKKLVLQNINSLYGQFTIDFEAPDFANGIFAITGPTGSGICRILLISSVSMTVTDF